MKKKISIIIILAICVMPLLTACGGSTTLNGTYVSVTDQESKIIFKGNKIVWDALPYYETYEYNYKIRGNRIDGDKIIITMNDSKNDFRQELPFYQEGDKITINYFLEFVKEK